MEQTLVIIKPDAFERNFVAKIMRRLEKKNIKIANIKFYQDVPRILIEKHYDQDHDKDYFSPNCDFMTSGPILVIIYEGQNAINFIRKLQGNRDTPGTIRGDYVTDIRKNLIHASDSVENAQREINIWFP
ncbi:nucleoside diphosphate kinase [Moumouvirus australiensis]|uniref:Nucleoside diphosphate kinase n=1 Tax=Moumouvirus australiensis TaxID=2109587 RepID=A0A2P1ELL9_9VIRU|nr:nucleoside diphosphate kinase [Moumouvirus australiensis]AVL94787.1 nucleoside diphosphate kinase [Moumouvirus australiensis]